MTGMSDRRRRGGESQWRLNGVWTIIVLVKRWRIPANQGRWRRRQRCPLFAICGTL